MLTLWERHKLKATRGMAASRCMLDTNLKQRQTFVAAITSFNSLSCSQHTHTPKIVFAAESL
jgi:hypothetical protein